MTDAGTRRTASATPRGFAMFLLVVVLIGYFVVEADDIVFTGFGIVGDTLAVAGLALSFLLQLLHSSYRLRRDRPRWMWATLALQATVSVAPIVYFGVEYAGALGFMLGSVLLLVVRPWSWVLVGAITVAAAVVGPLVGLNGTDTLYVVISYVLTGLIVFGLTRLADLTIELDATRHELAEAAVRREQDRFSRDLHDLLSYNLSAVTLRAEVAAREIETSPAAVLDGLTTIAALSRQCLADVRTVARGYRRLSVGSELIAARSMLTAAGVDVTTELPDAVDQIRIDERTGTVAATVLRESVANLLRHSRAERCHIAVCVDGPDLTVEVTNDGLGPAGEDGSGTGLPSLSRRVADLGGSFRSGVEGEWFAVRATVPLAG